MTVVEGAIAEEAGEMAPPVLWLVDDSEASGGAAPWVDPVADVAVGAMGGTARHGCER